jgi:D-inositol-3-phosphate glycosyltransferase
MAMSHELPVIVSDLPANKEIIDNEENGMLFKSEDADDLARQIKTFFETERLAGHIAKEALETIENDYGWDKIATQYLGLL